MKFLYQDILNFLSEKPTKIDLSEKLFQLGHEHEIEGDVFIMDMTPNRGDCLSIIGITRDLKNFYGSAEPLKIYNEAIERLDMEFENLSINSCPNISFLEIEIDGKISNYKPYLENYFVALENNKQNFFTDISNYISYELGQPTHCFDATKMKGKLVFEDSLSPATFTTLHDTNIEFKDQNCIFKIDNEVISLAGVMGGKSTACKPDTKKALIECAYFNPESIIGKSVKYNISSDAAYKFERGVDPLSHDMVLRRFIKVVEDHAQINSIKMSSFDYKKFMHKYISINVDKINSILGIDINKSEYLKYLESLGFKTEKDYIKIPSFRSDINSQNDLAEEIARLIGYNNIKSSPLLINKENSYSSSSNTKLLENFMVGNGFTEVINFPFSEENDKFSIKIDNPLDSNKTNFRTSLKKSLINNLLYNERRQKDSIKLFEISDIYLIDKKIKQESKLGVIVSGRLGNNYKDFSKKLDKKYLEELFNFNNHKEFINISEISREKLDTKKKDKIFYLEVSLDSIPNEFFLNEKFHNRAVEFFKYKPISDYPTSSRDFSFSITDLSKVNEVINEINNISDNLVKESFIFDFYKNKKTNTVKLGNRLIFQSHEKTLSENEINKKANQIIAPILKINGVTIQGM